MRKLLLILGLLLLSTASSADVSRRGGASVTREGNGSGLSGGGVISSGTITEVAYYTGPLTIGGNVNFLYDSGTTTLSVGNTHIGPSGNYIYSSDFIIDLDDPTAPGSKRECSSGLTNNQCLDYDYETELGLMSMSSPSSVIHAISWQDEFRVKQLYVGGIGAGTVSSLSSALVSFYKLEETTGTTVTDQQGTNTGTLSADASGLTTTGILNLAYNFASASSHKIDLGSSSTLKFAGDFSVEFWMNTSSTNRYILGNRAVGPGDGYKISISAANKMNLLVDTGADVNNISSATSVNTGTNIHVVCERSSTSLIIYLNGVADGTPVTVTGSAAGGGNTLIGNIPATGTYYNGKLDNIRFYNRALTQDEVTGLYNLGVGTESTGFSSGGATGTINAIGTTAELATTHSLDSLKDLLIEGRLEVDSDTYLDSTLTVSGNTLIGATAGGFSFDVASALVSYYKLEDNAANTTVVDTQAANTGTASRNTSNLTTTGKLSNAFNFSSASSDSVDLGSSSSLKFAGDFSVAFWISTSSTNRLILGNRSSSGNLNGYRFSLNTSGNVVLLVDAGASAVNNTPSSHVVTDGTQHFVVGTRNADVIQVYIDGSASGSSASVSGDASAAGNTKLGTTPLTSGLALFNGKLDNVQFFNRYLTPSEIEALYNSGVGTETTSVASASGKLTVKGTGTGTGVTVQLLDSGNGGTVTVLDNGSVGIGNTAPSPRLVIAPPAAETITAAATITANACETIKQITAAGAVTTNTTDTFTAPAATNSGCEMRIVNTGSNNITLDNNAHFKSFGAADVVLTADDAVIVESNGTVWYQISPLEAN